MLGRRRTCAANLEPPLRDSIANLNWSAVPPKGVLVKTKGLVHSLAFALALAPGVARLSAEEIVLPDGAAIVLPESVDLTSFNLLDEAEAREVACGDCCADSCGHGAHCKCGGRDPFFYAGTEVTFMDLDASSGGRITASFSDTTAPGVATIAFNDGARLEDFTYVPRIWFGRQFGERWGVVTRFWHLETTESNFPDIAPGTTTTGANFGTFEIAERARLYTFDVEATRSARLGKWKLDGTLGARHASIGVHSDFLGFGVFTTGNFVNLTLQNGFSFDGTGATSSLTARRQIGASPVSIFLSGRGSYMGGHTDSFGRSAGSVADSPDPPLVGAATVTRNNAEAELDIAEFQAGTQLDFRLERFPANAFFRAAVEYQFWDVDAPPTGGAGFSGTIGELTTNSFASAGIGGANMIGLAIATGFTW